MSRGLLALAALTLVLGVTTAASGSARALITGQQIKDHSITSLDLKDHTLQSANMSSALMRSLRHATEADHAAEADYAVNADNATNADNAKNAGNAGNAATVGGYAPNGLVRAARATQTSSVALTASYQTLATLSITAPSSGFVVVNSTVKTQSVTCPCIATARLRDVVAGGVVSATTVASVDANTPVEAMSATWVFPVAAAGTQTYVLEAYQSSGTAINAVDAVMSAIFAPFGSTGGSGL